jgi:polyisoprenoid-binding protein YceI
MATRRRRRLVWVIVGGVVLVAVVAVAAPFVYIHFIEGPAPAKLELPRANSTTSTTSSAHSAQAGTSASSPIEGSWNVGPGSVAGYRVNEVLIGQNSTAVGRTSKIWGSLTIAGSSVTKGTFSVDMASVQSDQSERNAHFDGPIMDVSQYPTATLTLSSPIALGATPASGVVAHYSATGVLEMHGVGKTVNFAVSAERTGTGIDVLADIPIVFANWNISNPSIGGFVTTADNGTLEVLLHLTEGAGNPASNSSGSAGSVGGGGPITVPSTTVPPLSVPSG